MTGQPKHNRWEQGGATAQAQKHIVRTHNTAAVANSPEATCSLPSEPARLDHQPERRQVLDHRNYPWVGLLKTKTAAAAARRIDLVHGAGRTQLLWMNE